MEKKYFAESELIINEDGSIFHLHVKPEQLADKVILVGDPGRVDLVASHFDTKECAVESREFRTVTGTYKGKRITVISTGIGCDNIDIVMNEVDALANIDFETRMRRRHCARSRLYASAHAAVCSSTRLPAPSSARSTLSVSTVCSTSTLAATLSATCRWSAHCSTTSVGRAICASLHPTP